MCIRSAWNLRLTKIKTHFNNFFDTPLLSCYSLGTSSSVGFRLSSPIDDNWLALMAVRVPQLTAVLASLYCNISLHSM
jgi:hypothetical protein